MTEYEVILGSVVTDAAAIYARGSLFVGALRDADSVVVIHRLRGSTWTSVELRANSVSDIHDAPSLGVDSDGYIYIASHTHSTQSYSVPIYKSTEPGALSFSQISTVAVTNYMKYPEFLFDSSGTVWLFYATGNETRDICYRTSSDSGETWSSETKLWESLTGDRPYFSSSYIGGEILLTTTSNNAQEDSTSGCYFLRHNGTSWVKADGTSYSLPVTKATADVCFDPTGGAAGFGIRPQKDPNGNFFVFVPRYVSGSPSGLYLCKYDSGWTQTLVDADCNAESLAIRKSDLYDVIGTKNVSSVAQVCRWVSLNGGAAWESEVLTSGSLDRGRGFIRNITSIPSRVFSVYADLSRSSNTDWTSDVYLLFNSLKNKHRTFDGGWVEQSSKGVSGGAWVSLASKMTDAGVWR